MVHVTTLSDNCESPSNATTSFQTGEMLGQQNLQPVYLSFSFHNLTGGIQGN